MEEFELELGETVIRTVHQHWILIAVRLIPFIILACLPLFIVPLFAVLATHTGTGTAFDPSSISLNQPLLRFALGVWWLILWMSAFTMLTKFFLTMWVITTQRIVDIKQNSLFSRQVSSFLLARVQDITTDVDGLLGTLIGFGHLNVETAGRAEKFSMEGVAHPEAIRDLIMREIADMQNTDSLGTKIAKTAADVLI
jgi:hypothetical protein